MLWKETGRDRFGEDLVYGGEYWQEAARALKGVG